VKLFLALAVLSLSGCGVAKLCNEHPTACGAITMVAVGCGTLLIHNHSSPRSHDVKVSDPSCAYGECK